MNWTNILIAILPALISAVVSIVTIVTANKAQTEQMKKDIKELQEHVKEHNGYAKLFSESTKDLAVLSERVQWLCKQYKQ